MTSAPKPTHQVVKWNANTGHVSRVSTVSHFDAHTARAEADRRNASEGREFKNVKWAVRRVAQ